jgi:hypothetical protein
MELPQSQAQTITLLILGLKINCHAKIIIKNLITWSVNMIYADTGDFIRLDRLSM